MPSDQNTEDEAAPVELTCPNAHTDQYKLSEICRTIGKPAGALKARHAQIAVG